MPSTHACVYEVNSFSLLIEILRPSLFTPLGLSIRQKLAPSATRLTLLCAQDREIFNMTREALTVSI